MLDLMRLQYQSGGFESRNRKISKRGNKYLRKVGYEVMASLVSTKPVEDHAVYSFICRKKAEGKYYLSAYMAGLNKFLHIYYDEVGCAERLSRGTVWSLTQLEELSGSSFFFPGGRTYSPPAARAVVSLPPVGNVRSPRELRFLREAAGCGLRACAAARAFLLRKETKQ